MKNTLKILFLVLCTSIYTNVSALEADLKVSTTEPKVGESFKITVNVKDVTAWNVHVLSEGIANNCSIDEVDITQDAKDTNKKFEVECEATSKGDLTVTLSGDITSEDGTNKELSSKKIIKVSDGKNQDIEEKKDESGKDNPGTGTTISIIAVITLLSSGTYFYFKSKKRENTSKIFH